MKGFFKVFIVFALILGIVSNPAESHAATKYSATVDTKILNVREKATIHSKKMGSLKKGAKVTVFSKTKTGWSQISYKSKKGYVYTKYLKFAPTTSRSVYSRNKNKIYVYVNENAGIHITKKYRGSASGWAVWNIYYESDKVGQEKLKEDGKGLYLKQDNKVNTLLHYPVKVGKTWVDQFNGDTYTTKITSLAKTVKTDAGTFKNVMELTITNKKKTYLEKAYYAPKIGLIKDFYEDKEYGSNETVLVQLKNK
ncbi:SH3 domain-containing protein [Bacillus salipaludis]|uniref:SH3 domain-containing protein n=1 Tax=Bacillus salipaludis TaxID=2547811 RepID=UPI002E1C1452|nr:SH3 domain-containing protein [Bacillus salipaludis]